MDERIPDLRLKLGKDLFFFLCVSFFLNSFPLSLQSGFLLFRSNQLLIILLLSVAVVVVVGGDIELVAARITKLWGIIRVSWELDGDFRSDNAMELSFKVVEMIGVDFVVI